jgi:hypothetical protein
VNPPDHRPREPRASIRMDAGLDAMTRAKLENLATAFHQSRAAVLRHVMRWGLGRRWTGKVDQYDLQGPVRHGFVYVESELYQHVQETAIAAVPRTAMPPFFFSLAKFDGFHPNARVCRSGYGCLQTVTVRRR